MPVKGPRKTRRTTPKKKAQPRADPVMIFTIKSKATGSSKATGPPKAIKELVLPAWYTDLYKASPRSFRNTIKTKTKLKKDGKERRKER